MHNSTHNVSRLFVDGDLSRNVVDIGNREAHYPGRVLRLKQGDRVVVFNGRGAERAARRGAHRNKLAQSVWGDFT